MKKSLLLTLLAVLAFGTIASAAEVWVDIQDNYFRPSQLYVAVGTVVKWTSYGMHTHTVTSSTGLFNSGDLMMGQTFSYTFNTTGDYPYNCIYHTGMVGTVHVRTAGQLSAALSMTPVGGPITIPASGGSFSYAAQGTNQTASMLNVTYWTKMYFPNNTMTQTFLKNVSFPAMGSRGATLTQNVAASAPAGLYHFFGYLGSNPDSVIAWNGFTFTKAVLADGGNLGGFESVMLTDWTDLPSADTQPLQSSTSAAKSESVRMWNSPEPFNPNTTINFSLPNAGQVQLEVFNVAGARVATLLNGYSSAGDHQVNFDASQLPSGLYVYRLAYAGQSFSNKMMLVK